MSRQTILVIFNSIPDEELDYYKRFYRFNLDSISESMINNEDFNTIFYDELPKDIDENVLIFILDRSSKKVYFGVYRDIYSRESSIQLPGSFSWDQFINCAKQTPQSCILFS